MVAAVRQFVDGRYGQVHLRVAMPERVSARPLLCLHMFPQSGRSFDTFMRMAGDDRPVIAPDFPGHGESDCPPAPIGAEDYASSMWEVVEVLAVTAQADAIDLFGVHAGGKLAVEMARQKPDRVNRIVLSSAAVLTPKEIDRLKDTLAPVPIDAAGTRFQHLWRVVSRNRGSGTTLSQCAANLAEMLRHGDRYSWGSQAVFEYNAVFPYVLPSITQPVALLNPADELYAMTPRTASYLPNVTLIDLPEWTHGYLDVHTRAATKLILDWLDNASVNETETDNNGE